MPPLVSVIIATRDRGDMLRRCITSLATSKATIPPTELLVIDNGSIEPRTLTYLSELERQNNARVLRRPGKFNYAALNNEAVSHCRGEIIAFLNNDVEAISPDWLSVMASQALRREIGAVGGKLLYDDGSVQHGGVLLGIGGVAGHSHKYFNGMDDGYQLRLQLTHNMSAVTAAVMLIRRSVFEEVGGFDAETFEVNYNDVDLCLRLINSGYRNIYCPDAVLLHHESRSRGAPTQPEAQAQWQRERLAMQQRWGELLLQDPHYSPHLSLVEENWSLSLRQQETTARSGLVLPSASGRNADGA